MAIANGHPLGVQMMFVLHFPPYLQSWLSFQNSCLTLNQATGHKYHKILQKGAVFSMDDAEERSGRDVNVSLQNELAESRACGPCVYGLKIF